MHKKKQPQTDIHAHVRIHMRGTFLVSHAHLMIARRQRECAAWICRQAAEIKPLTFVLYIMYLVHSGAHSLVLCSSLHLQFMYSF